MEKFDTNIRIKPIGIVKNDFEGEIPEGYETRISEIVLSEEFSEGLHRIEQNSHIVVLFWMDKVDEEGRKITKLHPKGREDLPLVGVFTTRSPNRPNPIGIRAVKLLEKNDNILKVEGLDAYNGSPVLDIKPYSVKHDLVEDVREPPWAKHLRNRKE